MPKAHVAGESEAIAAGEQIESDNDAGDEDEDGVVGSPDGGGGGGDGGGPTISPGNEATGRWTKNEHETFLKALRKYGKEWKKVALKSTGVGVGGGPEKARLGATKQIARREDIGRADA